MASLRWHRRGTTSTQAGMPKQGLPWSVEVLPLSMLRGRPAATARVQRHVVTWQWRLDSGCLLRLGRATASAPHLGSGRRGLSCRTAHGCQHTDPQGPVKPNQAKHSRVHTLELLGQRPAALLCHRVDVVLSLPALVLLPWRRVNCPLFGMKLSVESRMRWSFASEPTSLAVLSSLGFSHTLRFSVWWYQ